MSLSPFFLPLLVWVSSFIPLSITKSLCRMKERAKRAGAQRKEEDGERRSLQVIIIQNILYVIIKPVSSLFFSFTSLLFLLDQAGTDRGGTPKSVQGVSGSEEFTGPERHKCSAAPKHHHHPYTETHHCPQERGETFLRTGQGGH